MTSNRHWTLYLAQDKHLDYNWCGANTEIELRMATLLDGYLDQAERAGGRWNMDGTLWFEVYRRHRGEAGARRLLDAVRKGQIGYAANRSVLLWGLLSTELAVRACFGSLPIQQATGTSNKTALIMENAGLMWGAANTLAACGIAYLGRGIYPLRAESYNHKREPYPLFWWEAPGGKRVLVYWDLYKGTHTWGGYAEAFELARLAGEGWDAFQLQSLGNRNTPDVYRKRRAYIQETVDRYEAYGSAYPISSILLLGTGHDNWTVTDDYRAFIQKYNAESDGRIRLVDARYEDFFEAAQQEIRRKKLHIPTQKGSFGICWEEWGAHLGGLTSNFREAERLLRAAEASHALAVIDNRAENGTAVTIHHGFQALLDFAEHDMGGCNRRLAAVSAGVRSSAATQALDIARALCPNGIGTAPAMLTGAKSVREIFACRGGRVRFDPQRLAVASVVDGKGREWVPPGGGPILGEFIHTRYPNAHQREAVFPNALKSSARTRVDHISCLQGKSGVEIRARGKRWGFGIETRWTFYATHPWIDVAYRLIDGWTEDAQTVQFCFPVTLDAPVYRYDTAGAVLTAGPIAKGGDDLPGANPDLFSAQTFACVTGRDGGLILLTPDAFLVQFGPDAVRAPSYRVVNTSAMVTSMPLMNLTRNDRQFGQGGQREWTFRYRLIRTGGRYDPRRAFRESQRFGAPPFLQVPGGKPSVKGLEALDIAFDGGPVTAFKLAEDGKRLILRLWNVLDRPVEGSAKLPQGFTRADRCDALERRRAPLPVKRGRVTFDADAQDIVTIAFRRK